MLSHNSSRADLHHPSTVKECLMDDFDFQHEQQSTSGDNATETIHELSFYAYGLVGPLIIAIGLIGNGLTLATFLGRTPIWSNGTTYTYLKWLSITDTGSLLMAIPMQVRLSMPWRTLRYWEAFYQAHLELPVLNSFMGSSIFIVLCLTGTRFLAVFYPSRYRSVTRKNARAGLAVYLAISLAIALSAPLVMLKEVTCGMRANWNSSLTLAAVNGTILSTTERDYHHCVAKENTSITHRTAWKAFIVVSEITVRVIPVITLTAINLALICKFRSVTQHRRAIVIARNSNSRAEAARASERRKLILLSTIIVLFVCFNFPSAVLSIIYKESLENRRNFQVFRAVSNDCELANFAVNFYAYFLCSKDFRSAFFATFSKLLRCAYCTCNSSRSSPSANEGSHSVLGHVRLCFCQSLCLEWRTAGRASRTVLDQKIPDVVIGGGDEMECRTMGNLMTNKDGTERSPKEANRHSMLSPIRRPSIPLHSTSTLIIEDVASTNACTGSQTAV